MTVLKKRSTAILVAVLVIVLGTVFGVHRSVNAGTAKIEKQFYDGIKATDNVSKSTYVQPSIQSQLDKCNSAALGLAAVASTYPDLKDMTNALRDAQHALANAVTIRDKYSAYEKLQAAYVKLYAALSQQNLKENEKASSMSYAETLDGARGVIEKSDYNKAVSAFVDRTLVTFPIAVLKNLAFVTYPDYFGWR